MTDVPYTAISGGGPLREQVYVALRQDLMAGVFDPTTRLGEEKLAEAYGVSRTPVREAMARLLADGLVQRLDAGLFPYRPRLDDLADLYELRTTLELRGIDRVDTEPHDATAVREVLNDWTQARSSLPHPDAEFVARDESFHVTLLAASGNPALAEALRAVNARIRPVRMFDSLTRERIASTVDEHVAIWAAVVEGDLAAARASLLAHIDLAQRIVIDRATQALSMAKIALAVQN
ncbi:MAG: GntR family transcriptional regulator [Rhodococcus fascians]